MLRVERDAEIATVWLDHGPVNAMDLELFAALTGTIEQLDADETVRAIVLTGAGRAFSAGVDLKRILDGGLAYVEQFLPALAAAVLAPFRSATPVVAAINGHAIAGGAIAAMACDRVLVTDDARARIGLSELAVGVPFPTVPFEIAARRIPQRLDEVILTAALYPPVEACALGFVDEVVPAAELLDRATAEAARLAAVLPATFATAKEQLHAPTEERIAAGIERWDGDMAARWASPEVTARIAAFMQRTVGRG